MQEESLVNGCSPGILTSKENDGAEKAEAGGLTPNPGLKRGMVENNT